MNEILPIHVKLAPPPFSFLCPLPIGNHYPQLRVHHSCACVCAVLSLHRYGWQQNRHRCFAFRSPPQVQRTHPSTADVRCRWLTAVPPAGHRFQLWGTAYPWPVTGWGGDVCSQAPCPHVAQLWRASPAPELRRMGWDLSCNQAVTWLYILLCSAFLSSLHLPRAISARRLHTTLRLRVCLGNLFEKIYICIFVIVLWVLKFT